MKLQGKTTLITGGASGMGKASSKIFAKEGANLAIIDINEEAGQKTVSEIKSSGGKAVFFKADVSKTLELIEAINQSIKYLGKIDILFNHAGTIIVKPLHESTEEDYDRLMNINVRSAFMTCNQVIPNMLKNGGGSIVITSSIGGEKGFSYESLYCMTKGAVLQLARSIAVEYRDNNIRCNAVCPGFVKTDHGLREIEELDGLGQKWNEADLHSVQGRICNPEEVASAVLYLASDDARFITGNAFYVDNGWYAKG
ncbi:MAG: oxidoreductase [Pelagibacteraceae bacterium]|jgi:NAD(P)-dependent dehydrogenase (short-subunit alcohol dehydrogenase family)|nr:oxidoreductase [Pelagibacteraceae bacterium]|tara:strand:- start:693 stop:1457 length:765 start_codon:yes stop_codon:yes gene_type:complete